MNTKESILVFTANVGNITTKTDGQIPEKTDCCENDSWGYICILLLEKKGRWNGKNINHFKYEG